MPAFNAVSTIAESIESVLAQSEPDWELLIINDGSTDGTAACVAGYAFRDARVRLLETDGRVGPASARNVGLSAATGYWIAFLDSDDLWAPEKLSRQLAFMESQGAVLSFTSYRRIDANGNLLSGPIRVPPAAGYRELLRSNCIGCLTAMYQRSRFPNARVPDLGRLEPLGLWRHLVGPGRIGHEDFAFWLEMLSSANEGPNEPVVAHGLQEPLAYYRVGQHSISSNKFRAAVFQWLIYRKHQRLPWIASVGLFMQYALRGVIKHADLKRQ